MSASVTPYVSFRGTAREAMEFYHSILGGELDINTFGEFGITEWPEQVDKVMHSRLKTDAGVVIMASDVPATMEVTFGDSVTLMLGTEDDGPGVTAWYEKLSEGGTVSTPLAAAPWGDSYGAFVDRFGVSWQVNIAASAFPAS